MSNFDLIDLFRYLHPTTKKYTWTRTKPLKSARLDYFLSSSSMMDIVSYCKIKPSYRSDHSRLEMKIFLNTFTRGPGLWKFNCSLLKDTNYVKLVNEIIDNEKIKYAVPIYNPNNILNLNETDLHLTINDSLFLEMLLLSISRLGAKQSSFHQS